MNTPHLQPQPPSRLKAGILAGDARFELGRISTPTLVLWGEKETIFARSEQDSLMSALPNAVFLVYPETGHALHWERTKEVAKDLQEFMAH